ncbi:Protein of unknown function (DUF3659) [Geosmithia morbida]|uniref:Uncharacterized protein n=1 Tax=Geosmithia morbida TaxID=1094350 RepID=A0A9P4YQ52_9HYPO|nr:Protein of unknown function (DUF3659) [Geosmithia morbida]KAF4119576.1 Protein of unknown function (DUF3659) [Geosmithia morbida]
MSSPHTATPGDDAPHDTHTTHMIDIPYRGAFGEILDGDGEVVGHVVEDLTALPELQELDGALRVDASGNIYNENGEAIGRLNEARPGGRAQEQQQPQRQPSYGSSPGGPSPAAPAPRPASAPNPSEIYLDVKSTYDGIQLIIKIPSIFNRDKDNNNVPEDMKGTTR